MVNKKERLVAAIENGTVIDHIPSEKTYEVAIVLGLQHMETVVTIGYNYMSKKIGKKGIIKVEDKWFTDEEISRLSVVAPNVVLSIIKDYEVIEKKTVETPDEIRGIIKCNNPKCITNNEPMQTVFNVIDKEKGTIRCHYCEREQDISEVKLI
ncbi:MAG: aspartate carbamoyltransferase regulatory subunit [Prevotella sp.]|nr:aspartate carbamoyltransferase regulatory subunit [Prevotella sp.]